MCEKIQEEEKINVETICEFCGEKFVVEYRSDWRHCLIHGRKWCGCCEIANNPNWKRMIYGTGEDCPFEPEY